MIFSQIIILVTVLIVSDAIADECASGNEKLCDIIRDADKSIRDGVNLLEGASVESVRTALESADKLVVAVLKAQKSELIAALKKALEALFDAYVQVKDDCSSLGVKCNEVLFEVGYATLGLLMSLADIHPDVKTMENIEDRLESLYALMFDPDPSKYRDKLHEAAKEILTII